MSNSRSHIYSHEDVRHITISYNIDYLPVYFQACRVESPIRSSLDILPTALVCSPSAIVCGTLIKRSDKYRLANYIGWILILIGIGLLTLLKADSSTGEWVGFQMIVAIGVGFIVSTSQGEKQGSTNN